MPRTAGLHPHAEGLKKVTGARSGKRLAQMSERPDESLAVASGRVGRGVAMIAQWNGYESRSSLSSRIGGSA